jgi:diguanylate cyclase (GGDEF)-like protein
MESRRILILAEDPAEGARLEAALAAAGHWPYAAPPGPRALERIYAEPPDLLLLDADLTGLSSLDACREIKIDHLYGHLPILLLVRPDALEAGWDWEQVPVDDYLLKPVGQAELRRRVDLCAARVQRQLDTSPLTRLPGNGTLIRTIQRLLDAGQPFSLAYLDLDHFKSYNDKYGFARGDEILRMTGRLLRGIVRDLGAKEAHVGHIGGDDFACCLPVEAAEPVCRRIVQTFDLILPNFYDEEDRLRGGIEGTDRHGVARRFPLVSVSIGVATTRGGTLREYGDLSRVASEVKRQAKRSEGSTWLIRSADPEDILLLRARPPATAGAGGLPDPPAA